MKIQNIIAEEVTTVLNEEKVDAVLSVLDQIVAAAPGTIPELEKFVNNNVIRFLQKSLDGAPPLTEGDEELSDKIAQPLKKALQGAGEIAKGVAKGTTPITVPALKLGGYVGSHLPLGKKVGVLIAAAQDKNTKPEIRNAILFALANLMAGSLGLDLPDMGHLFQMLPGIPDIDSEFLHGIDDAVLLLWAYRKMKEGGVNTIEQLKRFGDFIGRTDLVDVPEEVPASGAEYSVDDDSLDAKAARVRAAQRKGRNFRGVNEVRLNTTELYQIIKEELEVVLTNEEATEIFDLDMSVLLDEMMKEEDSFSQAGEEIAKKGTEGVFTAKAKKAGMGAQEYAKHVLANTKDYPIKTVRQASFAKGAATVARENK
jgi:hypothetical protein